MSARSYHDPHDQSMDIKASAAIDAFAEFRLRIEALGLMTLDINDDLYLALNVCQAVVIDRLQDARAEARPKLRVVA